MAEKIEFFSEVETTRHGVPTSEYPGWFFPQKMKELEIEIDQDENRLKRDMVDLKKNPTFVYNLEEKKKRLELIKESKPKLSSKAKDHYNKLHDDLGRQLTEAMPSLDDMKSGKADPHEEVRKITTPCIKVDPEMARMAGVTRIEKDGRVNRNDAAKVYKMFAVALEKNSNIENLRR